LRAAGLANLAANSDPEQARQWLEQAAEAGEPFAINIRSPRQK
jgi:TPR repeat protein